MTLAAQGRDLRGLVDVQGLDLHPAGRGPGQLVKLAVPGAGPDGADDVPALARELFRHGVAQPAPGAGDQDRGSGRVRAGSQGRS